jgi:hypothetical protein
MREITPAQFIDQVAAELDEHGWTTGMTKADNGCVCLYGAIHEAVDFYRKRGYFVDRGDGWPVYWEDWPVAETAVMSIWNAAQQRTASLMSMQFVQPEAIVYFNDHVAGSVDDVKALLEEAKKELTE